MSSELKNGSVPVSEFDPERANIHGQLELFGVGGCLEMLSADGRFSDKEKVQFARRYQAAHRAMAELAPEDVVYLHAGLCQTGLPHSKPPTNHEPWQMSNGRFHLIVEPGTVVDRTTGRATHVGVPYGSKARLVFIHICTEGLKSSEVPLGRSMTAFMRRLGIKATGGEHGTIAPFKEQVLRLGRSRFSFQFEGDGGVSISDTQIADHLHLWVTGDGEWQDTITLTQKFRDHLVGRAVPLCDHAIAYLKDSSLKLDMYAFLAWRLPKLQKPLRLNWAQVAATFGSGLDSKEMARSFKKFLPEIKAVYPDMKVEVIRNALLLHPSKPPVPKTLVTVSKPKAEPKPRALMLDI